MEQTINKTKNNYQEYHRGYYQEHKDKMLCQARDWRILNSGQFIYFMIDEDGHYIYTGQFLDRPIIERLSLHLHGKSNLHMDANTMQEKYNLALVCYKHFDKYNLNKQDLNFLENYFKTEYENILGKNGVHFDEGNLSRSKEELLKIALEEPLQEFSFDKYLN